MDIIIIGAGGHSKILIDILEENNEFNILGLLDDNTSIHGKYILGKRILGDIEILKNYNPEKTKFVLSIGNNQIRRKLFDEITSQGFGSTNVISGDATISKYSKLGTGLTINAGVRIHPDAYIGDNVIIGMNATISHDSVIERDVHISPGVHVTGAVHIETGVDIGTGAVIIPGVRIGRNSIIGAGAVVLKDLDENGVYAGIPAKKIRDIIIKRN